MFRVLPCVVQGSHMQHTKLCQVLHGALAGSAQGFQMFWAGIFQSLLMAVLGIVLGYPWHGTRIPKDCVGLQQELNEASQGDAQDLSRHCFGCPRYWV